MDHEALEERRAAVLAYRGKVGAELAAMFEISNPIEVIVDETTPLAKCRRSSPPPADEARRTTGNHRSVTS